MTQQQEQRNPHAGFIHQALRSPTSEIRLLELLPGTGRETIQCNLLTTLLCDCPPYQPMSYCWGPQTHLVEILVEGQSFPVTRNLAAALRRLRQPKASCMLWVDAVCINQRDKAEKSFQIPLMAEIYGRGERTIVWLGEHDRRTARAFAMLEMMARYADTVPREKLVRLHPDKWQLLKKAMKKKNNNNNNNNNNNKREPAEVEASDLKPALLSPAYWVSRLRSGHARTSLFGRPWFQRVWIIQEIAMSPRAVVVCGRHSADWATVEKAYGVSELWDEWEDGQYLQALIEMRTGIQVGRREELGGVMLRSVLCQATEPVDRIYAVLGLAKSLPPGSEIAIDYRVDTDTKFIEATRACLTSTRDLRLTVAGCTSPSENNSAMPSWAWSPRPDPARPTHRWHFHRAAATKRTFHAVGKTAEEPSIRFSGDGRLLFLRGIVLDEIAEAGPVFGSVEVGYKLQVHNSGFRVSDKRRPRRFLTHLHASKRVADPLSPGAYPGTGETRRQAWISFLTDIAMMSDGLAAADERETREAMRREEALAKPYHILGRGPGELPWSREESLRDREMPRMRFSMLNTGQMMGILAEYMAKRRVVRTAQGYVALCDRYADVGDHLALIDGVCVPVALRPAPDGQWKIIGESYTYGVMHGELWSGAKTQSLCIR